MVFALISLKGLNVHKKGIIRGVSLNQTEHLVIKFLIANIVLYDIYIGNNSCAFGTTLN